MHSRYSGRVIFFFRLNQLRYFHWGKIIVEHHRQWQEYLPGGPRSTTMLTTNVEKKHTGRVWIQVASLSLSLVEAFPLGEGGMVFVTKLDLSPVPVLYTLCHTGFVLKTWLNQNKLDKHEPRGSSSGPAPEGSVPILLKGSLPPYGRVLVKWATSKYGEQDKRNVGRSSVYNWSIVRENNR